MPPRNRPPRHLPEQVREHPEVLRACAQRDLGRLFRVLGNLTIEPERFTATHIGVLCRMPTTRVQDYIRGTHTTPTVQTLERVADGLHIPGHHFRLTPRPWENERGTQTDSAPATHRSVIRKHEDTIGDVHAEFGDEEDALELARRVASSDVGHETIARLEATFDDLAVAYPVTPPRELIERVRLHLGYVGRLIDVRKTLEEQRRLVTVGGWLSLLAATVHIDLKQYAAATARLDTASSLARHAQHDEIRAWCYETTAWRAITEGDYRRAVELAQAAQDIAPLGSSAHVQATAQEGRAWARLHQPAETYRSMDAVGALVASRSRPDRPGHHYQYDPDKVTAYSTTTLAWLGDPAAETFARELIARLRSSDGNGKWPRRLASANLDLALALIVTDRLDEAASCALTAVSSGHVAPSSYWRALEVVAAVEARELPEAEDLREAYSQLCAHQSGQP